jgi:hypothetical protein
VLTSVAVDFVVVVAVADVVVVVVADTDESVWFD